MLMQIVETKWYRMRFQVMLMSVKSCVNFSDPFGYERNLTGPDHADCDIGIAAQQILITVRQDEFYRDLRVERMKPGEDGGKNFASNHFARGDPYGSARFISLTRAKRHAVSAAAAIASADGINLKPASVGDRPSIERVKSLTPRDVSSAAIWRPIVGCVVASVRAAPDRLPSRTTARNARNKCQSGT